MTVLAGRQNIEASPRVPLPLYARSVGQFTLSKGQKEFSSDIRNPFIELIFGDEGNGETVLYNKVFQINPGDIFYYLPNEDHVRYAISTEWKFRWLVFDGPLAEAIMMSFRLSRHQKFNTESVFELLNTLEKNISDSDPYEIRHMSEIVYKILTLIGGNQSNVHSMLLPKRCLEIIKDNISNPELNITMICDILQTPRSTLSKAFSDKMGISPGGYIRDMRFVQAQALLKSSDLSIGEIAKRCGMPQLSSFSRFVRRYCGVSPQEFRKTRTALIDFTENDELEGKKM